MTGNKKYEKATLGWFIEQAKKEGFDNIRDWQIWKRSQELKKKIKNIDHIKIFENKGLNEEDRKNFYNFWSKVDIKDNTIECWDWTVSTFMLKEHGQFNVNSSHKTAYILSKGPIPYGLQVQHLCNNPRCCNPNHLIVGTPQQNSEYMIICGRQNSPKGESNGNAKLKEDQVREILISYEHQLLQHPELKRYQIIASIAKRFGINERHVDRILNGELWNGIYISFTNDHAQFSNMNIEYKKKGRYGNTNSSVLTEDNVREIHKLYKEQRKLHPGLKQWQIIEPIAKKFGIGERHVNNIVNGKRWHHIYEEYYNNR